MIYTSYLKKNFQTEYYLDCNGYFHNTNGPAEIIRDGKYIHYRYFIHGYCQKSIRLNIYHICG